VIAAVHGYCIGGGVDLIAACDIRLASADALFSVREAKVAIVADLGSLQRLPHIIGKGHVAELAYTGKDISAERAESIGLVNHVTADSGGVLADATKLAVEFTGR
jgi:enoyl-CoA hydratase